MTDSEKIEQIIAKLNELKEEVEDKETLIAELTQGKSIEIVFKDENGDIITDLNEYESEFKQEYERELTTQYICFAIQEKVKVINILEEIIGKE